MFGKITHPPYPCDSPCKMSALLSMMSRVVGARRKRKKQWALYMGGGRTKSSESSACLFQALLHQRLVPSSPNLHKTIAQHGDDAGRQGTSSRPHRNTAAERHKTPFCMPTKEMVKVSSVKRRRTRVDEAAPGTFRSCLWSAMLEWWSTVWIATQQPPPSKLVFGLMLDRKTPRPSLFFFPLSTPSAG